MGFITVAGTLSFLFTGPHRQSFFRPTGCSSLCLEASPENCNNEQQHQPLSPFNNTVAKYDLGATEIQRENRRRANRAFTEKYGSVFNATVEKYGLEKALEIYTENGQSFKKKFGSVFNATAQKYGLEKAKEIYSDNARKSTEKYGTAWDRMKSKHGLEKAKAMRRETSVKRTEKYGSIFNATLTKYGPEKAKEMYRQSMRKANVALMEKYTYEEIQQMRSVYSVKSARKRGLRTRYPGVNFNRAKGKWFVQFSCRGKRYWAGAAHASERDAVLAHDECVRKLGLNRPLHFPREGERTSYIEGIANETGSS